MVICLEQGADLHMAQLMPLPLTVSCSSKIQIGFTFLVLAHLGSPGHRAVKRVSVCVCAVSMQEQTLTAEKACSDQAWIRMLSCFVFSEKAANKAFTSTAFHQIIVSVSKQL